MAEAVDNTTVTTDDEIKAKSYKSKGGEKERVLLFTIDDEEFTVPKKPGMKAVMRYLNVARKTGNDLFAAQQLVEDMLGTEKWEKFLEWEDMDDEVANEVIEKCIAIAVASVESTSKK